MKLGDCEHELLRKSGIGQNSNISDTLCTLVGIFDTYDRRIAALETKLKAAQDELVFYDRYFYG